MEDNPLVAIVMGFFAYLLAGIVVVSLLGQALAAFLDIDAQTQKMILGGELDASPYSAIYFYVFQGLHMVISYGLTSWLLMNLQGQSLRERGLGPSPKAALLFLAGFIMLGAILWGPLLNFNPEKTYLPDNFAEWEASARNFELDNRKLITGLLSFENPIGLLPIIFVMAVLPGICEELFFRAFLQKQLMRMMGPILAIFISAFIFSFFHFQFHGFFGRLALGFLLGWMFWKSGSLYPSMLGHFVFNGVSLLGAYFTLRQNNWTLENSELIDLPWYMTFIALVLSGVSLYIFHLISSRTALYEKKE